jgi:hypothetical protein
LRARCPADPHEIDGARWPLEDRRPRSRCSSLMPPSARGPRGLPGGATKAPSWPPPTPEPATGVPDKCYRGPQQGSLSNGRSHAPHTLRARSANPHKRAVNAPPLYLLTPCLRRTGVPNKRYRGPQQALPGSPTKTTGVSNKNYRGARQALPGCPTKITGVPDKRHSLKLLQNGDFLLVFRGPFVFVSLVVLCC